MFNYGFSKATDLVSILKVSIWNSKFLLEHSIEVTWFFMLGV